MSLICALGGHEAARPETYNSGYYFSRCRRCGRDMIRAGASWSLVPAGHRVVWRSGFGSHSLEPDYAPHLPVLHRAANLPAVRPPHASWSRQLVRGRQRPELPAAAVAVTAEAEENPYPALLALAALAAAAVQMLFSLGSRAGPGW